MPDLNTANITGYRFSRLTLPETISLLADWSAERCERARFFACVNPHSLEQARKDLGIDSAKPNPVGE